MAPPLPRRWVLPWAAVDGMILVLDACSGVRARVVVSNREGMREDATPSGQ